jgi:multidrug resistance efflux pump
MPHDDERRAIIAAWARRYLLAAVLVGSGLFFSLVAFEQGDRELLSRLVYDADQSALFSGVVQPVSESTVAATTRVGVQHVLAHPGQIVAQGTALFIVDDGEARRALPATRLEVEDAATQVRILELGLGSIDREFTDVATRITTANGELDVALRQAASIATPQARDSTVRASAAHDLAVLKLERTRKLFEEGVVARQDVDDAEVAVRIAADNLEQATRSDAVFSRIAATEASRAELRLQIAGIEERRERLQRVASLAAARMRHERATVALQVIQERLAAARIDAPVAATVAEVRVARGDLVEPGAVLARLVDLSRLVVEVQVPSAEMATVRLGARADVTISAVTELRRVGTVRSFEPTPGANGTHRVVVEFDNPDGLVLAGQAAEVAFPR